MQTIKRTKKEKGTMKGVYTFTTANLVTEADFAQKDSSPVMRI